MAKEAFERGIPDTFDTEKLLAELTPEERSGVGGPDTEDCWRNKKEEEMPEHSSSGKFPLFQPGKLSKQKIIKFMTGIKKIQLKDL